MKKNFFLGGLMSVLGFFAGASTMAYYWAKEESEENESRLKIQEGESLVHRKNQERDVLKEKQDKLIEKLEYIHADNPGEREEWYDTLHEIISLGERISVCDKEIAHIEETIEDLRHQL